MAEDRYAKFDYSRLISWNDRLRREWPFLEGVLRTGPSHTILDLGSGTGEHARLMASNGFQVVGIDSSPAMIEKSRASAGTSNATFIHGDIREAGELVKERAGAAICLGNALPHLSALDDLQRLAASLRKALLPGAPVIVQLLNYERFEAKKERALPLTFLPDPEDPGTTIIFLRAMELHADGTVTFMPTTLRMRTDREEPIELVASQRVEIRGWRAADLVPAFKGAGFPSVELFGSYQKAPFEPAESRDLIVVAR